MNVLFDFQTFQMQAFGGISRYFSEIMSRLPAAGVQWELPVRYSDNAYLKALPGVAGRITPLPDPYREFMGGRSFRGKKRLYALKERFFSGPAVKGANRELSEARLRKGDFDLFHPTYYDPYFLDLIGDKPFLLTVHDMTHELFPENLKYDPAARHKKRLAERAARIIAVSQHTKNDLVALFGVDPAKVTVVYHACSLDPSAAAGAPAGDPLPERYLLYVGSRAPYKNFFFFLYAILPLLRDDPRLHIVCTGSPFYNYEKGLLRDVGIAEQVHHRYATDVELAGLYKGAVAFVFPSLYEGFGIPILEAFSCGCPVLASNTGSLPEVGGDAARYFEPQRAESILHAVREVLNDPALRTRLAAAGLGRVKHFSWEQTARETAAVYKSLVS